MISGRRFHAGGGFAPAGPPTTLVARGGGGFGCEKHHPARHRAPPSTVGAYDGPMGAGRENAVEGNVARRAAETTPVSMRMSVFAAPVDRARRAAPSFSKNSVSNT